MDTSAVEPPAEASRAVLRNVVGGLLAMTVTHLIGQAVGTQV